MIHFSHVSFQYPTRSAPTVSDISLAVEPGDFLLLSGPTGCGKTTLLKMLNGIIPHLSQGRFEGTLTVAGNNAAASSMEDLTREVGVIFQCPDDQIVADTVEEEIAFGLENLGMEPEAISGAIDSALARIGIADLKYRSTRTLSGGQKQRVVIASQIALRPKILAFDEPLSQLDPRGAREVMHCIADLNRQGITVILIEHRIADVAPFAGKVLLLDKGRVAHFGPMRDSFRTAARVYAQLGLHIPEEATLSMGLGMPEIDFNPMRLEEKMRGLIAAAAPSTAAPSPIAPERARYISLQHIRFGYKKETPLFADLNLEFHAGESVALMGANGSGKSTLLSLLAGLRKPQKGSIVMHAAHTLPGSRRTKKGMAGLLIQNPDLMLFCESVEQEMLFGTENRGIRRREGIARVDSMLEHLSLAPQRREAPFSLSVGQRLRTALGAVLTMETPTLLLDEPTTGQNQENIFRIMETVKRLQFLQSIIFCTHDIQTAMRYADRIIILREGAVVYDGAPSGLFDDPDLAEAAGLIVPLSVRIARNCGLRAFQGGAAALLQSIQGVVP